MAIVYGRVTHHHACPRVPFLVWAIVALGSAAPLSGQVADCDLTRSGGSITGECLGAAVELRPGTERLSWVGTIEVGDTLAQLEVTTYDYPSGSIEVVRTPWGWFVPTELGLEADPPALSWSFQDEAPPSQVDLRILDHARTLITDERTWDRADDRACLSSDSTFSLYCALIEATRVVTGAYQHRQPALQVVRSVVRERWPERIVDHALVDFNNHSATTWEDLVGVFDLSRGQVGDSLQ